MDRYAVAHVDEIGELDDGRAPMRAVRHHFGITSFGANAWIAREAGARIINESSAVVWPPGLGVAQPSPPSPRRRWGWRRVAGGGAVQPTQRPFRWK